MKIASRTEHIEILHRLNTADKKEIANIRRRGASRREGLTLDEKDRIAFLQKRIGTEGGERERFENNRATCGDDYTRIK